MVCVRDLTALARAIHSRRIASTIRHATSGSPAVGAGEAASFPRWMNRSSLRVLPKRPLGTNTRRRAARVGNATGMSDHAFGLMTGIALA
jgi:hypothetical protein